MHKSDLYPRVAVELDCSKETAKKAVDAVLDSITDYLAEGQEVVLKGFGVFNVRTLVEREGRNPGTGEKIQIPTRRTASFRPSNGLKRRLNGGN
ncbi:MAG: HU family DNA-binding protein [Cyanobacteria bacterium J06638_20]